MKKMKLYTPGTRITQSQHVKCSWCESGVDPTKEGVCRLCHDKLQTLLTGQKWRLQRHVYLASIETGMCHGFLVAAPDNTAQFVATMLSDKHAAISNTGLAIPPDMTVDELVIKRARALIGLSGIVPTFFRYHPCRSIIPIVATRIDHILPWHCYPSLFWQTENHQGLCTDCNAKKTNLDGSHRTNVGRSV